MKTKLIKLIIALVLCISLSGCTLPSQKVSTDFPNSIWEYKSTDVYIIINVDEYKNNLCNFEYKDSSFNCICYYVPSYVYFCDFDKSEFYIKAEYTYIYDDDKFDIITTESDLLKIFDIESDNTDELRITLTRVK